MAANRGRNDMAGTAAPGGFCPGGGREVQVVAGNREAGGWPKQMNLREFRAMNRILADFKHNLRGNPGLGHEIYPQK